MKAPEQAATPRHDEAAKPREDAADGTRLTPDDFYYENGLLVFTTVYHLKRGYCCNSGCRHCPYR